MVCFRYQADEVRNRLVASNLKLVGYVVARLPRHIIRAAGGTEEAVSIGHVALILAATSYDATRGAFSTFAVRCIRNRILDSARTTLRRQEQLPVGLAFEGTPDAGRMDLVPEPAVFPSAADEEAIAAAVARLPGRLRYVIRRRFYYGWRFKDIGRQLGLSRSRTCMLCRQALARLRRELERGDVSAR